MNELQKKMEIDMMKSYCSDNFASFIHDHCKCTSIAHLMTYLQSIIIKHIHTLRQCMSFTVHENVSVIIASSVKVSLTDADCHCFQIERNYSFVRSLNVCEMLDVTLQCNVMFCVYFLRLDIALKFVFIFRRIN
jgi:hypothetical protein